MKRAFTMIELVFVILVIGILAAVAIPKLSATRDDALVTRARTTVASLRSALATERQKNILRGNFSDINGSTAESLLEYGLPSDWTRNAVGAKPERFTFTDPAGNTCIFDVNSSRFVKGTCNVSGMSDL